MQMHNAGLRHSKEGNNRMRISALAKKLFAVLLVFSLALGVPSCFAQEPPLFTPEELDRLVSRIALYPDPLLAQVLTASTFPDQIPEAAEWADEHHYLTGPELAEAIEADHLSWDPSVLALLPFPSVLDMMASDMAWTTDLGNAVLQKRAEVMDAIQRMRRKAMEYGYLRSNEYIVVSGGPYITIEPVNPDFIVVPAYDPLVVFAPLRPGLFVGGAITFGFGVTLGAWFRPWGWGACRIGWGEHAIFINNVRWERGWRNRGVYVHAYPRVHRWVRADRIEHHELFHRTAAERAAARGGFAFHETHHRR
jgi:hypothetical protein